MEKDKPLRWTGTFFLDGEGVGRVVLDDITQLLEKDQNPKLILAPSRAKDQ